MSKMNLETRVALLCAAAAFCYGLENSPGTIHPQEALSADSQPDSGTPEAGWKCSSIGIRGVYPHLAALSDSYSEAGIGALVPWADRLWYVSYVAHIAGEGVGLYEILAGCPIKGADLSQSAPHIPSGESAGVFPFPLAIRRRPESIVGTHANRMIHPETQQLLIGPYLIDTQARVRVLKQLASERLTGTMRHLTDPAGKVYYLAMEGNFYEVDLATLQVRKLFDLTKELGIDTRVHFKGAYTAQGRVVVANNSYFEEDQREGQGRGRLAEWDGQRWTILRRTAFCDATTAASIQTRPKDTSPLWANGWDRRSVLLCILHEGQWHTYRLPKGSQSYDQAWCTEWPRIRPLRSDLMLLDMHGLYYKMSPELRPGQMAGLEPYVCHLKMTPDFCVWHGRLVLAGDENSSMNHRHRTGGQPQSNLWFGTLQEVGRWGRPAGWGGPWLDDPVPAGTVSDPFLIQGFEHRTLHLAAQPISSTSKPPFPQNTGFQNTGSHPDPTPPAASAQPIQVTLEVDPDGTGRWKPYLALPVPLGGYAWHVLPKDLQAVWLRLKLDRAAQMSAQFHFAPGEPIQGDPSLFAGLPLADQSQKPRVGGALLPFANRLWLCAYVDQGPDQPPKPAGLYEITESVQWVRRAESVPGIFSNRSMVAGLLSIGPHLISADGTVRTIAGLENQHLVASVRLGESRQGGTAQKPKLGLLTAAGRLLEVELQSLAVESNVEIPAELGLPGQNLHFQAGHTTGNTLIVAARGRNGQPGLLAERTANQWKILDQAHFAEVCNLGSMSENVLAVGWDAASTVLMLRSSEGWQKYRLPKATQDYPPAHADYSPRVREVVTERILLDAGGLFYEVSGLPYAWSIRPIATHNRRIADFCSWRGLLVLAGCQADTGSTGPLFRSGDGVGLWFGAVDDLWMLGKIRGVGGPWLHTPVQPHVPSDPYLMTHFDRKRLELQHDADQPVQFTLEVDFTVQRNRWHPLTTLRVNPGQKLIYEFPEGYSVHWIRLKADRPCRATAWFVYD